ncbi:MAG: hypothetical protein ACLR23_00740 [Clostridia bacterium]
MTRFLSRYSSSRGRSSGTEICNSLVSNIDYDGYTGRIAVGRIDRGQIHSGDQAVICRKNGTTTSIKLSTLCIFKILCSALPLEEAGSGRYRSRLRHRAVHQYRRRQSAVPPNIETPALVEIDEPVLSMTILRQQKSLCRARWRLCNIPPPPRSPVSVNLNQYQPAAWRRPIHRMRLLYLAAVSCI